jgi:hypothetical protein
MLGVDTPIPEIVEAARGLRADVVGISVSAAADPKQTAAGLRTLLNRLPARVELWLGGQAGAALPLDEARVRRAPTWADVDALARSFARAV